MANRSVSQARLVLSPYTQSVIFDSSSHLATVPITPDVTNGFSFALWCKPRLPRWTGNGRMLSYRTSDVTNGFSLMQEANTGKIYCILGTGSTKYLDAAGTGNSTMFWRHLTVTYTPAASKIYLNANLKDSDSGAIVAPVGQTLTIGRRSDAASENFYGRMAGVCFQNTSTPWTQTQIDDLYFRGIIPSGAYFWSLDGNVLDQNGANGLTLTGGTYTGDRPC